MTHPRPTHTKTLLAEMAAILVTAALLGVAWNHKLLFQAWTGQAPTATRESAQTKAEIVLPLGLMQVKELYDRNEALFIDARDAMTYAAQHIKEARSLPLVEIDAQLPRFIAEVPAAVTLVAYCNGYDCHDSRELGARLLRAGYRSVYVFEGGYPEWRDAGYPTEGGKR
jgi:rhodanese-related sulfurtransferase